MTDQQLNTICFFLGMIATVLCVILAKVQSIAKYVTKGNQDTLKGPEEREGK